MPRLLALPYLLFGCVVALSGIFHTSCRTAQDSRLADEGSTIDTPRLGNVDGLLGERMLPALEMIVNYQDFLNTRLNQSSENPAHRSASPQYREWLGRFVSFLNHDYRGAHERLLQALNDEKVAEELLQQARLTHRVITEEQSKLQNLVSQSLPALISRIESFSSVLGSLNSVNFERRRSDISEELAVIQTDSRHITDRVMSWLIRGFPFEPDHGPCGLIDTDDVCLVDRDSVAHVWRLGSKVSFDDALNQCLSLNETLILGQSGQWAVAEDSEGLKSFLQHLREADQEPLKFEFGETISVWLNREVGVVSLSFGADDRHLYMYVIELLLTEPKIKKRPGLAKNQEAVSNQQIQVGESNVRLPETNHVVCQRTIREPRLPITVFH